MADAPTPAPTSPPLPLASVAEALYLSPAVAERLAATAQRVAGARAVNTLRALRSDLALWTRWCRASRRLPLPARPADVAAACRVGLAQDLVAGPGGRTWWQDLVASA